MKKEFFHNEAIIFPCYAPEDLGVKNQRFEEAFELHMEPKSGEDIVAAIHGYHDAFMDGGCVEAGVNALSMVCETIANALAQNPNNPRVLQEKLNFYIEELEDYEHPAGKYYRAVAMIYNLFESVDAEECSREGWELLEEIAQHGNEFAYVFLEYVSQR